MAQATVDPESRRRFLQRFIPRNNAPGMADDQGLSGPVEFGGIPGQLGSSHPRRTFMKVTGLSILVGATTLALRRVGLAADTIHQSITREKVKGGTIDKICTERNISSVNLKKYCNYFGVDPFLFLVMGAWESGFRNLTSGAGARGYWQVMGGTAQDTISTIPKATLQTLGKGNLTPSSYSWRNIDDNMFVGIATLFDKKKSVNETLTRLGARNVHPEDRLKFYLAAYNGGGRINQAIEIAKLEGEKSWHSWDVVQKYLAKKYVDKHFPKHKNPKYDPQQIRDYAEGVFKVYSEEGPYGVKDLNTRVKITEAKQQWRGGEKDKTMTTLDSALEQSVVFSEEALKAGRIKEDEVYIIDGGRLAEERVSMANNWAGELIDEGELAKVQVVLAGNILIASGKKFPEYASVFNLNGNPENNHQLYRSLVSQGDAFVLEGKYEKAIESFEKAEKADIRSDEGTIAPLPLLGLAEVAYRQGNIGAGDTVFNLASEKLNSYLQNRGLTIEGLADGPSQSGRDLAKRLQRIEGLRK
ncbi:MAG: transglycosylase SLT domain-containing protein [Candidatus Altiarchaeota archaeon]